MSRRSFFVAVGVVLLLVGTSGAILHFLLRYEPKFYRVAVEIDEAHQRKIRQEVLTEVADFLSSLRGDRDWYARFTDEQMNCYLSEEFTQRTGPNPLLPEGISDPRVFFQADRMYIAFRYKSGLINTVVSVTLRAWLPRTETNVVAIQLESIRAGLVPFTAQWLLEHIAESARQNGIEVDWFRHEGYPVALLRFQADQARPTMQFKGIQIEDGHILVHGSSARRR